MLNKKNFYKKNLFKYNVQSRFIDDDFSFLDTTATSPTAMGIDHANPGETRMDSGPIRDQDLMYNMTMFNAAIRSRATRLSIFILRISQGFPSSGDECISVIVVATQAVMGIAQMMRCKPETNKVSGFGMNSQYPLGWNLPNNPK